MSLSLEQRRRRLKVAAELLVDVRALCADFNDDGYTWLAAQVERIADLERARVDQMVDQRRRSFESLTPHGRARLFPNGAPE